ncbi:MAG: class I SAM-dependent methyltransferase [Actinomycetota bacterium]|nr:class I SAM-dependent methyltransferase [Actinomycetota bacterium]
MRLRERGLWVYEHLPSGGRLLDVGCHACADTVLWADRAAALFGADVDPALADGPPEVRKVFASAGTLPFRSASFDVVTFVEVLEHLPTHLERLALEEIRRVLRPDGLLLLTTPHKGWFAWLDPMDTKRRLRLQHGKGHKHYSMDEIRALLDGLFEIELVHRSSLILHPISTWLGIGNRNRWPTLRAALSDWDYRHRFGPASFNLALVGRPVRSIVDGGRQGMARNGSGVHGRHRVASRSAPDWRS